MSVSTDLERLEAPRPVLDAGRRIDAAVQAGLSPPTELVAYVRQWVTKTRGNNRYGR